MLLRPTTEGELDRVLAWTPAGSVPADRYLAGLSARHYRPEWTWVADEGGQILACAIWWGLGDAGHPLALDGIDARESVPGRTALAARLMAAGHDAFRAGGAPRPRVIGCSRTTCTPPPSDIV